MGGNGYANKPSGQNIGGVVAPLFQARWNKRKGRKDAKDAKDAKNVNKEWNPKLKAG